tara:strand:- start:2894 stop:3559 length:666 start_codon:yes stop_codon:yes gene_type:complete
MANNFKRAELNLWDITGSDNFKIKMNDNDVSVLYNSTHPGACIKFPDMNIGTVEKVAATIVANKALADGTKAALDAQIVTFTDYKVQQDSVIASVVQSVTSEIGRATGKENELQTAIDVEQVRIDDTNTLVADLTTTVGNNRSDMVAKINEEKVRAETVETELQGKIDNILGNVDTQALNSLTDLANEINSQGSDLTGLINGLQDRIATLEGIIEEALPSN